MKISADLIDLEMAADDPDATNPQLDLASGDGDASKSRQRTQNFAILKNQILQLLHLDPSECLLEISYKRQENKVSIDSDQTLNEAFEFADDNSTTLEIKIDCEKGAMARRTQDATGNGAYMVPTNLDFQNPKSLRLDCDEEELAWAKQHGWVRALIQEVEGKVLAATMAQITNMLKDGLKLTPPKEKKARKLDFQISGQHTSPIDPEYPKFRLLCNVCSTNILGPHYKCSVCKNFDLCLRCETIPNIHDKSHPLLKIRLFDVRPHIQKNYKKSLEVTSNKNNAPSTGLKRKHEKINKNDKGDKGCSSNKKLDAKSSTYNHFYSAEPGKSIHDIWILENCGTRNWKNHIFLKYCGSDPNIIPSKALVPVITSGIPCLPGKQIEVEVNCSISSTIAPGTYAIPWRLTRKGEDFGPIFSTIVSIATPDENTPRKMPKVKKCTLAETPQKEAIAEVLTAAAAANEDPCNHGAKPKVFVSSTNTPNNTPFVLSPPKSPEPQLPGTPSSIPLEPTDPSYIPEENELQSCGSSSESDSEFVVIPIPPSANHSDIVTLEATPSAEQLGVVEARKESVSSIAAYSLSECSTPEMLEYEGSLLSFPSQDVDKEANQALGQVNDQETKSEDVLSVQNESKKIDGPLMEDLEFNPSLSACIEQDVLHEVVAEVVKEENSPSEHSENSLANSSRGDSSLPSTDEAEIELSTPTQPRQAENSFITDVKTCFTSSVYPSVAEMTSSNKSLTAPCFLPENKNSNAFTPSKENNENCAGAKASFDSKPQNVSQASQTCPDTSTTFTQVPQESMIQVLPISMVSGVANQVLSTAKAMISGIQQLGPPAAPSSYSPNAQPPAPKEKAPPKPPTTFNSSNPEDGFIYPPEAWIGNEMTPQEYQYFEWKFASTIQNFHEMGFYDQIRIERLLKKFNGDVHKVADALLRNPSEDPDNNWFTTRHGSSPSALQPQPPSFSTLDFD